VHDADLMGQLKEYRAIMVAYFRVHGLLPILVSAGQRVGDVYDPDQQWALLSTAADCFPGLAEPAEIPTELVHTVDIRRGHVAAALGLGRILSIAGTGKRERTVKLSFTHATIRRVAQMALRKALCAECGYLLPLIEGKTQDYDGKASLPFVVGTVLHAKRQIFVGADAGAEMKASAQQLGSLSSALRVLDLDPTLSAGLGYGGERGLLLQSEASLPVALAPAFLPKLIFDRTQGGVGIPDQPIAVKWVAAEQKDADGPAWPDGWVHNLPLPLGADA